MEVKPDPLVEVALPLNQCVLLGRVKAIDLSLITLPHNIWEGLRVSKASFLTPIWVSRIRRGAILVQSGDSKDWLEPENLERGREGYKTEVEKHWHGRKI